MNERSKQSLKYLAVAAIAFLLGYGVAARSTPPAMPTPQTAAPLQPTAEPPEQTSGEADYKSYNLLDLKLNRERLIGTRVSVGGLVQSTGGRTLLKASPMDPTPLILDITRISEEQRAAVAKCAAPTCSGSVRGTIRGVVNGVMIVADSVWIN